jgi:hypothetical protein
VPAEIAGLEIAPAEMGVLWPAARHCALVHGTRRCALVYGTRACSGMSGTRRGCMDGRPGASFGRGTVGLRLRRQCKHGRKRYQRKHYPSASGRFHFPFTLRCRADVPCSLSKWTDAINSVARDARHPRSKAASPDRARDNLTRFPHFVLLRICNSLSRGRDRRRFPLVFFRTWPTIRSRWLDMPSRHPAAFL